MNLSPIQLICQKQGTSADRKHGEEEAFERHNEATELGTLWPASKQKKTCSRMTRFALWSSNSRLA